jgi:hypothetical protein
MAAEDIGLNDILEVRISGTLHGQTWIETFRFKCVTVSAAGATATVSQCLSPLVAKLWDNGTATGMRYMQSEQVQDVEMTGQKIAPTRYVQRFATLPSTVGAVAGNANPSGVAVVIQKRSALAGRKYRGRWFIPGLPLSWSDQSQIKEDNLADISLATGQWNVNTTVTGTGGTITLAPYIYNPRAAANAQPIVVTAIDIDLRYQRRREVGRGV